MRRSPWLAPCLVVLGLACDGHEKTLSPCEEGTAPLVARTVDGMPTIATLTIVAHGGQCMLVSGCEPTADAPCAEVHVRGVLNGVSCDLTFTSVHGETFQATATIRAVPQSGFQCSSNGDTITAFRVGFDPAMIDVDFSSATADGGDAGEAGFR
jgi:hypothetical protein